MKQSLIQHPKHPERKIVAKLASQGLPWPTNWHALFDESSSERPLLVEIGFGYGHTLRHLTTLYPQANIVGLEISNECLVKAEKAIERGELPNVRVAFSRAETALYHLFMPASIDGLYINFPDPWFKSRHERRRLMQRDTLDAMVSRMKPGAAFYLATDIAAYAEMSAELLENTPGLSNQFTTSWVNRWPDDLSPRAVTKYEARGLQEGRDCFYFFYQRNTIPVPDVPVIEEKTMPHLVITTPLTFDEMRAQFAPFTLNDSDDGLHANVQYVFLGERSLLFEVFVNEPTIEQRVAVMLIYDADHDDYTLRLGQIGNPRPTDGMHLAVRGIGDWLLGLHPDAKVVRNKTRIDGN